MILLRLRQLYRGSGELGLFRVVLLAGVLLPLVTLFLIQRIANYPYTIAVPAAALYILWLIHSRRRDYRFLYLTSRRPFVVFLSEYIIFSLPVAALLVYAGLYFHTLVFFAVVVLISLTLPSSKAIVSLTFRLRMVPADMFEWYSGMRKNLFVLVLCYIPGLFGFYQVWMPAVSLFILTMVFTSFYSEYEPLNVLLAGNAGPGGFLSAKIARHAGYFALLVLPLFLTALIHQEYRWAAAGYYLASLNLMVFSILLKYYQYRPVAFSGAHQVLVMFACIISVILPVALLIAVLNVALIFGAIMNLKTYFPDA